jgi:hypothetical protein
MTDSARRKFGGDDDYDDELFNVEDERGYTTQEKLAKCINDYIGDSPSEDSYDFIKAVLFDEDSESYEDLRVSLEEVGLESELEESICRLLNYLIGDLKALDVFKMIASSELFSTGEILWENYGEQGIKSFITKCDLSFKKLSYQSKDVKEELSSIFKYFSAILDQKQEYPDELGGEFEHEIAQKLLEKSWPKAQALEEEEYITGLNQNYIAHIVNVVDSAAYASYMTPIRGEKFEVTSERFLGALERIMSYAAHDDDIRHFIVNMKNNEDFKEKIHSLSKMELTHIQKYCQASFKKAILPEVRDVFIFVSAVLDQKNREETALLKAHQASIFREDDELKSPAAKSYGGGASAGPLGSVAHFPAGARRPKSTANVQFFSGRTDRETRAASVMMPESRVSLPRAALSKAPYAGSMMPEGARLDRSFVDDLRNDELASQTSASLDSNPDKEVRVSSSKMLDASGEISRK